MKMLPKIQALDLRVIARALLLLMIASRFASAHTGLDIQIILATKDIERHPHDALLYIKRGELYRVQGEWDSALADFEKAESMDPGIPDLDFYRGKTFVQAGRMEAALPLLDRVIGRDPKLAEAFRLRGQACAGVGRGLDAARDYSQAITLIEQAGASPQPEDYIARARALLSMGDAAIGDALPGLDEGIAKLGPAAALMECAIELELKISRYDAALSRLELIGARSQRKDGYLARRGEILVLAGRHTDALQAYQQALSAINALPRSRRGTRSTQALESKVQSEIQNIQQILAKEKQE